MQSFSFWQRKSNVNCVNCLLKADRHNLWLFIINLDWFFPQKCHIWRFCAEKSQYGAAFSWSRCKHNFFRHFVNKLVAISPNVIYYTVIRKKKRCLKRKIRYLEIFSNYSKVYIFLNVTSLSVWQTPLCPRHCWS